MKMISTDENKVYSNQMFMRMFSAEKIGQKWVNFQIKLILFEIEGSL